MELKVISSMKRISEMALVPSWKSRLGNSDNCTLVIFFKADSNENSLRFVGEVLRAMPGIADTTTSPMTVLKEHN